MLDLDLHLLAKLLVERTQRLVHQHDLGLEDERPGKRHPLLLASGKLVRPPLAEAGQVHHAQRRLHLLADGMLRSPALDERKGDVLEHRLVREERVVLEHDAHIAPEGRDIAQRAVVEGDVAGCHRLEAGEHQQDGGLARARRPEQRQELAPADFEIEAVHDIDAAVIGLFYVPKPDQHLGFGTHR